MNEWEILTIYYIMQEPLVGKIFRTDKLYSTLCKTENTHTFHMAAQYDLN